MNKIVIATAAAGNVVENLFTEIQAALKSIFFPVSKFVTIF
jgi:hypothetical protein